MNVDRFPFKPRTLCFVAIAVSISLLSMGSGRSSAGSQAEQLPANSISNQQSHEHSHAEPEVDSTGVDHEHYGHGHEHGTIELSGEQATPTLRLIAHPDARHGWNLEVQVTDFRFAPERVNQASTPNEGHAHLYINGEKITRLYSNWYYLESLPPGRHEVTVSLNANGHEALTINGQPIQATVEIEVP
jgi:hypothetical protein